MFGLLPLVASLLRFRARASVALLCVWATLLIANLASAEAGVQAKTRVWDFESASALNVCPISSASAGQHQEIRSCSAGFASGSPHAARGAPKIHPGQQGKHIVGHNNFKSGRSILKAEPAELAKRAGTGSPVNKVPRGQPGFRERVQFDDVIGDFVQDGVATPTRS